jgi:hypothetical protein
MARLRAEIEMASCLEKQLQALSYVTKPPVSIECRRTAHHVEKLCGHLRETHDIMERYDDDMHRAEQEVLKLVLDAQDSGPKIF